MVKETFELLESIALSHTAFSNLRGGDNATFDITPVSKGQLLKMLEEAYNRGLADGCSCGI